jgi:hypothetical protein
MGNYPLFPKLGAGRRGEGGGKRGEGSILSKVGGEIACI